MHTCVMPVAGARLAGPVGAEYSRRQAGGKPAPGPSYGAAGRDFHCNSRDFRRAAARAGRAVPCRRPSLPL